MPSSSFIEHFVEPLHQHFLVASSSNFVETRTENGGLKSTKERLQLSLAVLEGSASHQNIDDAIQLLMDSAAKQQGVQSIELNDAELRVLEKNVLNKVVVALYAESMDLLLAQSVEAEKEAEWWAEVERSRFSVMYLLLQTLPSRVLNLLSTIKDAFERNGLPLRLSQLSPNSLRRLLPAREALQPSVLVTSLFPHLHHSPQLFSLASPSLFFGQQSNTDSNINRNLLDSLYRFVQSVRYLMNVPILYTRQECLFKRRELERIRNEKAQGLGELAQQRHELQLALNDHDPPSAVNSHLEHTLKALEAAIHVSEMTQTHSALASIHDCFPRIDNFFHIGLGACKSQHISKMHPLSRPSRLTLIWPQLLLGPPLAIYTASSLYASRTNLLELAQETVDVVKGFVLSWLIEPLKDVISTVRSKDANGIIVSKEGVSADLDSLERMSLSLAREHLNYTPEELKHLSRQIRLGDLTPVLKLYEEDIRSPLKSALTGTLLRTVFIQVQKAKVDIDQALAGIDRLLKSQELTFAFVGVAPALSIVYLVGGYFRNLWRGGRGRGRYGGKRRRAQILFVMRRIERLLVAEQPLSRNKHGLSALTTGLLMLSVAQLRDYAETYLPLRSKLREGFLEDVEDLQDPVLDGKEKRMIIERMWRSWGTVLGWNTVAGDASLQ